MEKMLLSFRRVKLWACIKQRKLRRLLKLLKSVKNCPEGQWGVHIRIRREVAEVVHPSRLVPTVRPPFGCGLDNFHLHMFGSLNIILCMICLLQAKCTFTAKRDTADLLP